MTLKIPEITTKIYDLLHPLEQSDRQNVIDAVFTLLGQARTSNTPNTIGALPYEINKSLSESSIPDIKAFFDAKDPQSKIEEIAVAARYRELYLNESSNKKDDFIPLFKQARRNFDANNFKRDLDNAKTKKLFNRGAENTLSYYGQKYVDTLPNRADLKKISKPKKAGRKKTASKSSKKQS
jgi:hypothetical protein